ncbi:DeoR/GlpR family DNA-binding transcription regulator [Ruminococcaceae bacterium OttesenSCG-928-L11]|nr:DeoR/GlpR family DNA-binding transcription regulator [Ruminococcaceae bacterium OttesenSCG-928-L11]
MNKRHRRILELLIERERLEVARLAELVEVSQVTVRKDLDQLERQGLIRREHGYAVLGSRDDLNNRLAYHYDVKKAIAAAAAATVRTGETVLIESGSCCALLAEELAAAGRDITIITNSAFIAGYVRRQPGAKIVLLGGDYQVESQVMVGPITRKCAEEFFVEKLFVGADGFAEKTGFTGSDRMRAEAVRDMAKQAERVIVLTESEKFSQQGVVALLAADQIGAVYTDSRIPPEAEAHLQRQGVDIYKVE